MTWVTWRLHRLQLLLGLGLTAAVAVVLVVEHVQATGYLAAHGIEGCQVVDSGRCTAPAMAAFEDEFQSFARNFPMVLLGLPVLLGMFTGAPLFAREFEQGTHILGLTQSVSRFRWWLSKLLVVGTPILLGMFALGLVSAWAFEPLHYVTRGAIMTPGFETQGPVLGAYTVLAFAVGATAGLFFRNTLAAMAATLLVYLVVVVGVANLARPGFAEPAQATASVAATNPVAYDAWRLGAAYYDASGHEVPFEPSTCTSADTARSCLENQGVAAQRAAFHPADRFWRFQGIESGIHVVLGGLVLAAGLWRVRRRVL
ncbi:ABC transporter permease [Amycolatopsis thermoflava]|uniref:ABC transporter permease n=1 Tax=Amycolatopsis thermoflava TaxID=84480 RepID=UPI003EBD1998